MAIKVILDFLKFFTPLFLQIIRLFKFFTLVLIRLRKADGKLTIFNFFIILLAFKLLLMFNYLFTVIERVYRRFFFIELLINLRLIVGDFPFSLSSFKSVKFFFIMCPQFNLLILILILCPSLWHL